MRQSNGQVSDCRCAAGPAAVSQVLPWAYQGGEGRVPCLLIWKAVRVRLLLSTCEEFSWSSLPDCLGAHPSITVRISSKRLEECSQDWAQYWVLGRHH